VSFFVGCTRGVALSRDVEEGADVELLPAATSDESTLAPRGNMGPQDVFGVGDPTDVNDNLLLNRG